MELFKIEKLVQKYFEAETTLQEEETLKNYFSKNDIPEHLEEYKPFFNFFSESKTETSNETITLPDKKRSYIKWLSVAAMFALIVSVYSYYQNDIRERKEAEQAYFETQRALQLISQNLNKGNNAVAQLETFERVQNKIFK